VRLQRTPNQPAIEYTDERLRIVPDALWQRVKARQRQVFTASEGVRNALRSRKGKPNRHLFSGILQCERCGSNFVRINQRDYRCATFTNGGKSACGNGFKLNAAAAERLLLEQIESELLSPAAVDAAVMAYHDEAKKARREQGEEKPRGVVTVAVARKVNEIEQLKQLVRAGTIDATTLQPAIDAAERERERLITQADGRVDANIAAVTRMLPEAAGAYRAMVRQLGNAREVLTDAEYTETRALVFELLGGRVPVKPRADGSAALALTLNLEPIIKACGSTSYNLVAGACFCLA
jgi:hypothetical protein